MADSTQNAQAAAQGAPPGSTVGATSLPPTFRLRERKDSEWVRQALYLPRRMSSATGKYDSVSQRSLGVSLRGRQFSSTSLNFADTTLGGNRSLNPRPQFTRHADIDAPQLLYPGKGGGRGAGRQYLESIDAPAQRIYFQFGNAVHNSMTGFISQMYDRKHALMVNKGAVDMALFRAGQGLMMILLLSAVPAVFIGLNVLSMTSNAVARLMAVSQRAPTTRFYYVSPAMPLYWTSLQTAVNTLFVNMQLTEGFGLNDQLRSIAEMGGDSSIKEEDLTDAGRLKKFLASIGAEDNDRSINFASELAAEFERIKNFGIDNPEGKYSRGVMKSITDILPDIFAHKDGGIDVRRVATRYQRLADVHRRTLGQIVSDSNSIGEVRAKLMQYFSDQKARVSAIPEPASLEKYMRDYANNPYTKLVSGAGDAKDAVGATVATLDDKLEVAALNRINNELKATEMSKDAEADPLSTDESIAQRGNVLISIDQMEAENDAQADSYWKARYDAIVSGDFKSMIEAELHDGSAFVSFIVDYQGSVSESFSNSFTSSALADAVNQKSSENRNRIFDFAGGNIASGAIGNMIEKVGSAMTEMAMGALDMIGLKGLGILGGSAFADVPDHWENSSAQWSSSSFTIQLRSPYGHPYALMHHCFFPALALLVAALPRSTGPASYGPPLYCKLWNQGRCQYQVAMIENIQITRGASNAGWNIFGQGHGIDITFDVRNLSNIMHVPIALNNSTSLTDALGFSLFDDENNYTDYMATLAGLGIADQHYITPKWRLRRRQAQQNFDSWMSMSNFTQYMVNSFGIGPVIPGQIIAAFAREAELQ